MTAAPGAGTPLLSAILCSYDRAELLREVLESLCRQTLPRECFEVVLVDDGSRDHTADVARSFGPRLPVRYVRQENAGLAAARNRGIAAARAEVLLFLDDDDVADPGLLEAHLEAHRRHPEREIGVLGYTRLAPSLAADPLMHFVTEVGCFLFAYPGLQEGALLDFAWFWGGRSSCKRSLLLAHGLFDPVFRFGCEDIELAFRLSRHGFKVVYHPRAISTMIRRVTFDEFCARVERQGRSNYVFSRLHPDPAVQRWTEVAGADEAWRRVGPAYELLRRSARELDRVARMRLESGLGLTATDTALLHQGYWTAFQAARVKGIVGMAAETEHDPVASAARGAR